MGFQLPDLTAIEPSTGGGSFEILPVGIYRLGISEVSEEKTNDEGNSYAYIEFTAVEGEHEGVSFRVFYNRQNINQQAVDIANRELSALGHAVEVYDGDADRMLHKTFMAKVGIKPANVGKNGKQYGESNKIVKYYLPGEEVPPAGVLTPAPAATPVPAPVRQTPVVAQSRPGVSAARPWAKRA